jgi:hypothetical protein
MLLTFQLFIRFVRIRIIFGIRLSKFIWIYGTRSLKKKTMLFCCRDEEKARLNMTLIKVESMHKVRVPSYFN